MVIRADLLRRIEAEQGIKQGPTAALQRVTAIEQLLSQGWISGLIGDRSEHRSALSHAVGQAASSGETPGIGLLSALQIRGSQLVAALIIQSAPLKPQASCRGRHINSRSSNLCGLLRIAFSRQEPCRPLAPLGRELSGLALLPQELNRGSLLAHGLALLGLHIQCRALDRQFTRRLRLSKGEQLGIKHFSDPCAKALESKRSTALIQAIRCRSPLQKQPLVPLGAHIGADALKNLQRSIRRLTAQQRLGIGEDHLKAAGVFIEVEKRLPQLPEALIQAKGDHPLTSGNELLAGSCLEQLREGFFW